MFQYIPFIRVTIYLYKYYVKYNFREIINKFSDNNEGRGAVFAGVLGYNVHIY